MQVSSKQLQHLFHNYKLPPPASASTTGLAIEDQQLKQSVLMSNNSVCTSNWQGRKCAPQRCLRRAVAGSSHTAITPTSGGRLPGAAATAAPL